MPRGRTIVFIDNSNVKRDALKKVSNAIRRRTSCARNSEIPFPGDAWSPHRSTSTGLRECPQAFQKQFTLGHATGQPASD